MRWSRLLPIAAAAGLSVFGARTVQAQAWLPPRGEVALTLGYSRAFADQHIDWLGHVVSLPYQGNALGLGTMTWNSADSDLSYGITDRVAVRMSLPFVASRYVGAFPHTGLPGHRNIDDGSWHGTFQDLNAEVRFKATRGALVVTPLLGVSVPTHSYEYFGHAAAGRDLTEGRIGVNVGRLLGPALPNAYAQVRYTFAVPEKALGISHDRSNLFFDVGYFVTPALTVSVVGDWQKTHGGWRVPIDFPMDANIVYHDQLARSDYFRLGGTASYALTGSIDVSVNAYASPYVRSEVNMAGFGVNVTYSFSPSQIAKRSKTPGHPAVRARPSS
jgi:hypothetical protein